MSTYRGEHEDILLPFIDGMRYKLAAHSKKGDSWKTTSVEQMLEYLDKEVVELKEAIRTGNRVEIQLEAADIGNFAMFIAAKAVQDAASGKGTNDESFGVEPRSSRLSRNSDDNRFVASGQVEMVRARNIGVVYDHTGSLVVTDHHMLYRPVGGPNTPVDPDPAAYEIQGHWEDIPNGPSTKMWKNRLLGYVVYEDTPEARKKGGLLIAPWTVNQIVPPPNVNASTAVNAVCTCGGPLFGQDNGRDIRDRCPLHPFNNGMQP